MINIKIQGYELFKLEYKNNFISIYIGSKTDSKEKNNYEIYFINKQNISPENVIEIIQIYNKLIKIDHKGIPKVVEINNNNNEIVIVLESSKGITPSEYLAKFQSNKIEIFLGIAIQIAETLGIIHRYDISHKFLRQHNIKIDDKNGLVRIINFSFESIINPPSLSLFDQQMLNNYLPYISPEQTGRMNRTVDYRTDFYSLGILFYEILTGSAPFKSEDPFQIIHYHIARKAKSPAEINSSIPEMISKIVMKLISKNAEDRYESGSGLSFDLQVCIKQLKECGKIDDFLLLSKDTFERFSIPQKLYGREHEVKELLDGFKKVCSGQNQITIIAGGPGVGKSVLVNEIYNPVVQKNGFYAYGKFEKFKKNIPYFALIQAFKKLFRQILSESDEVIQITRNRLTEALGENAQIIIDIIPDVELVMGKQAPVPLLWPKESQNRFNMVFFEFIEVFTRDGRPLVIFLDDLQWADHGSLNLLNSILTFSNMNNIYFIGAYRNNEVESSHPLLLTLDEMKKSSVKIKTIFLEPLNISSINKLLSDTLKSTDEQTYLMAELVHQKTFGNPFFVKQFLISLYKYDIICFSTNKSWEWNLDGITRMNATDNVIELMSERINFLSKKTQDILKIASCMGNTFTLKWLSIAQKKSFVETYEDLSPAVVDGLIYKFDEFYIFGHDRIREVCYSLIPENIKNDIHFEIGNNLLRGIEDVELEANISDIVNQLNYGIDLIKSEEDKNQLADLNLRAGLKAKMATAFKSALKYFKTGQGLLNDKSWNADYKLAFLLHLERAECEYMCSQFEEAELLFEIILKKANTRLDKGKVYNIKAVQYTNNNKMVEAINCGIDALALFGVKISHSPGKIIILKELIFSRFKLRGEGIINKILNMTELSDPEMKIMMTILMTMTAPAYFLSKELLTLVTLKMLNLSLKFGNSIPSAYAYAASGIIFGAGFGKYTMAFDLGLAALKLNDKINNRLLSGRINFLFGNLINHWKKHAKTDIEYLLKGYKDGYESGDLIYAGYNINMYILTLICTGSNLADIKNEINKYSDFFKRSKNPAQLSVNKSNSEFVMKLLYPKLNDSELIDPNIEKIIIPESEFNKMTSTDIFIYYNHNTKLFFLLGELKTALDIAEETEKNIKGSLGLLISVEHYFYFSLIICSLYHGFSWREKKKYNVILMKNIRKIKDWAENSPENFDHKYMLISGEMARINGNHEDAKKFYNLAINSAIENEYFHNAALAYEIAAQLYFDNGLMNIAENYILNALKLYREWGAVNKVNFIIKKYSHINFPIYNSMIFNADGQGGNEIKRIIGTGHESFDLTTILKASRVLSGEIILSNLFKKIMNIVVENAGAEKGYLILSRFGNMFIEAESAVEMEDQKVFHSESVNLTSKVPVSIINFVKRTNSDIILNNPCNDAAYAADIYILNNKPKSIMCLPVLKQNKLIGILYLENNLTPNAFTLERQQVLKLIVSQAAISLENALLYEDMSKLNQDLGQEITWRSTIEDALEVEKEGLRIINKFLQIGLRNISLEEKLELVIREIFVIPWLSFTPKGGILIFDEESNKLTLKTHLNFSQQQIELCAQVELGRCICGKAALSGQIEFASEINDSHDNMYEQMVPHGHYCVPIKLEGRLLGVMVLYLAEGHKKTETEINFLKTVANAIAGIMIHSLDENKSRVLEMQLVRSQKMESIGRLAGGIAHDFNNMLTVIIGTAQLLSDRMPDNNQDKNDLDAILMAGEKASKLTKQLLTFSKRQTLEIKVVSINLILENMLSMLERIIGGNIKLKLKLNKDLWEVMADPVQLEQIIMNLVINSRDAIKGDGSIEILTDNIEYDEQDIHKHYSIKPGVYALISVSDSGDGMEEEVINNMFDPFFTTKEEGQGTGLGLATVYGVVKQHKGYIHVESKLKSGTTIRIYLPALIMRSK